MLKQLRVKHWDMKGSHGLVAIELGLSTNRRRACFVLMHKCFIKKISRVYCDVRISPNVKQTILSSNDSPRGARAEEMDETQTRAAGFVSRRHRVVVVNNMVYVSRGFSPP